MYFRTLLPYYNQVIKEENDYDNEIEWDSLSTTEQKKYKQMRKEVSKKMILFIKSETYPCIAYGCL
jgi:hypothetical protein